MIDLRRFLFAIFVLLIPIALLAQTAQVGQITGTVKDPTGAVLPGVNIEAKHQEKGVIRSTTSDASGQFRMPSMPLGPYTITATLSGFETATLRKNLVENEKTTDVTIPMKLGATSEAIIVSGDVPIVDKTNVTAQTRVRADEFQKLPVGRNYQTLEGLAPGIPGTGGGNVNAHGALSGNNQFIFDGADVTDPTTGTFASNLNFEAIQEVSIYTSGISAEYGRAVGAIVNVITKSGGNDFSGSAKWLGTNDNWNPQNKTHSETTGASLARTKFDHTNPVQSYTLGGPIWKDRAWFFGAYEKQKNTSPQRQTVVAPDNFQQTTISPFWDARGTFQVNANNNVWIKKHTSPTNGFVIDYWANNQVPVLAADKYALTRQDQTANLINGQWSGVFGSNLTAEVIAAKSGETITVFPFAISSVTGGAPHQSEANSLYYNGATFDGFVNRPRRQATGAISYFVPLGRVSNNFKFGYDWQSLRSGAQFAYPNNQFFVDKSFDAAKQTFVPDLRLDFDPPTASTSKGKITSLYARDKMEITPRLFVEAGLRYEKQTGNSDIGIDTVNASSLSPRLFASYDLQGNGKSIVLLTYGRFYQFIIQSFSDSFAQIPQQGNYNGFAWDGTQYVPTGRVTSGGSSFQTNTSLNPTYTNEVTGGYQRQFGNTIGVGVRGIWRKWGDLIDDVRGFNADGTTFRRVENYAAAKRQYKGLELTFEKRFSQHWYTSANYTYSRSTGNQFSDTFTALGDWIDANCTNSTDPSIGTNGTLPCSTVQEGAVKNGRSTYDRPNDLKLQGAYTFNLGPAALTAGLAGEAISGVDYTEARTMTVLNPVTGKSSGNTATYFYETRGAHRLPGYAFADGSLEATFRVYRTAEIGIKGEMFNITDMQRKIQVNNTTFCANTTNPSTSCTTARNSFGTATARGSFYAPRSYRITTLLRF